MNDPQIWPIGVFTSIDAGLGVRLEVANELKIPTIQLHTPHREGRTPKAAEDFSYKLDELGIKLPALNSITLSGIDGAQRVRGANPPKTRPVSTTGLPAQPEPPERPVWRPKRTPKSNPDGTAGTTGGGHA